MKSIGIVMGSKSDLPVVQKTIDTLNELGIPFELHILSAHRTPNETAEFARQCRGRGFGAVIAAAGMANHLAGAIAANTTLPVVGLPCAGSSLNGMDALLSTVQMPAGIPVATVSINGGVNAAILAAQILAVDDAELSHILVDHRTTMAERVLEQNTELQRELNHH